jgi:carboxylesterase
LRGVLLLHGFAGSRDEVRPLYDALIRAGYKVAMPVLKGHEADLQDLAKSTYHDWIQSAKEAYEKLSKQCSRITVVGFSMGGLIAVQLYQVVPFYQLVTINTPVYYWDVKRILYNLCSDFKTYSKKYFFAGKTKPIGSLLQFQLLLSRTKPLFKTLSCRALVIQTQDDDTVHTLSAKYIVTRLKGEKNLLRPKRGGHIVLQSEHAQEVIHAVLSFLSCKDSCN